MVASKKKMETFTFKLNMIEYRILVTINWWWRHGHRHLLFNCQLLQCIAS